MLPSQFNARVGIKKGARVLLQDEPREFRVALSDKLPADALLVHEPPADVLIHFLQPLEMLELLLPRLKEQVRGEGAIWIVAPADPGDPERAEVDGELQDAASQAGLERTKALAFDSKSVMVRFQHPKDERKAKPKRKRGQPDANP